MYRNSPAFAEFLPPKIEVNHSLTHAHYVVLYVGWHRGQWLKFKVPFDWKWDKYP